MAINQAYLFVIFTINGIFIGLLFDFFRILRKSFKTTNFITYIEDILFWVITGISIIFSMYNFSNGELRLFMFIGLTMGITIYMLTISKIIIKIMVRIIRTITNIIQKFAKVIFSILKFLYRYIDKFVLRPSYKIFLKRTNRKALTFVLCPVFVLFPKFSKKILYNKKR